MCGIAVLHLLPDSPPAGSLRAGQPASSDLASTLASVGRPMLARLEHRGPDGTHARTVGRSWLGHTRLSIVDVEGGDQPIADGSGDH